MSDEGRVETPQPLDLLAYLRNLDQHKVGVVSVSWLIGRLESGEMTLTAPARERTL